MSGYEPSVSESLVVERTGRSLEEWFGLLDRWGARSKPHREIARFLAEEHQVSAWWCQTVAVEYERSRGLRKVGQQASGDFAVSMQRTVALDARDALDRWRSRRARAAWLPQGDVRDALADAQGSVRTSDTSMGPVVRFDLPGPKGGRKQRVEVAFSAKAEAKTAVSVQHRGLTSTRERSRWRARWKEALEAFKASAGP
jgi:hypothetical protein